MKKIYVTRQTIVASVKSSSSINYPLSKMSSPQKLIHKSIYYPCHSLGPPVRVHKNNNLNTLGSQV